MNTEERISCNLLQSKKIEEVLALMKANPLLNIIADCGAGMFSGDYDFKDYKVDQKFKTIELLFD